MIERHPITDRAAWLRLRQRDVTGSSVAALLGVHERISKLELWHHHRGTVPFAPAQTAAMERGEVVEPGAIKLIKKRNPDWEVIPATDYYRDPDLRLGGTPDLFVRRPPNGKLTVVDIKSVERSIFAATWIDEAGGIAPPLSAALQLILYKHLTGADAAMVAPVRIGFGCELDLVEIPEPPGLWQRLVDAAREFWRSVETGTPPEPDYHRDAELLLQLHRDVDPGSTVDLTGNNRVLWMRDRDAELAAKEKTAFEERRALKAELIALMGAAEVALYDGRPIVTAKSITRKAYSVGEKQYRDIRWKKSAP